MVTRLWEHHGINPGTRETTLSVLRVSGSADEVCEDTDFRKTYSVPLDAPPLSQTGAIGVPFIFMSVSSEHRLQAGFR